MQSEAQRRTHQATTLCFMVLKEEESERKKRESAKANACAGTVPKRKCSSME